MLQENVCGMFGVNVSSTHLALDASSFLNVSKFNDTSLNA
jgi:hypothetical protein